MNARQKALASASCWSMRGEMRIDACADRGMDLAVVRGEWVSVPGNPRKRGTSSFKSQVARCAAGLFRSEFGIINFGSTELASAY